MKIIRDRVFETNSSSTHALVIPKSVDSQGYSLSVDYDVAQNLEYDTPEFCYGRCQLQIFDDWVNKLAYIYIVLRNYNDFYECSYTEEQVDNFKILINKLYSEVLNVVQFKPSDEITPDRVFHLIDHDIADNGYNCWVDHVGEVPKDLIDRVLSDEDFVKRFIFNTASYITVGGDEYSGFYIKKVGFEYDYEDLYEEDNEWSRKLDELSKDYDIYLKGN